MKKARGKLGVYEVTTFEELEEHGRLQLGLKDGEIPWSFSYSWYPVKYDKDHQAYIIADEKGTTRFHSDDVLLVNSLGNVICVSVQAFRNQFTVIEE